MFELLDGSRIDEVLKNVAFEHAKEVFRGVGDSIEWLWYERDTTSVHIGFVNKRESNKCDHSGPQCVLREYVAAGMSSLDQEKATGLANGW